MIRSVAIFSLLFIPASVVAENKVPTTVSLLWADYEVHVERIKRHLPPDGEVRVITITDKQFERMMVFWGKTRKAPEEAPCQLELF